MRVRVLCVLSILFAASAARAATYPTPVEGDFVIRDFQFASGESLPQLRIHYRTFGKPRADAHGVVRNAVLIMHGTGGSGASLVREEFAGGCADSGFAASVWAPTICGVGPIGGRAHSPEEYLEIDSIVPRAQALALTILRFPAVA